MTGPISRDHQIPPYPLGQPEGTQGGHPVMHEQRLVPVRPKMNTWSAVSVGLNVGTMVLLLSWLFWLPVLICTIIGHRRGPRRTLPWVLFGIATLLALGEIFLIGLVVLIAMPPGEGNPIPGLH